MQSIDGFKLAISLFLIQFMLAVAAPVLAAPTASSTAQINPQDQQDQYVIADGVRLHYVQSGSGRPVVLIHGNDGTLRDFTMSIFDQLAAKYRTLAFDRPGHGQSELPVRKLATPEIQAQLLHRALERLAISRPLLVAQSWSGAIALSYALQFPDELSGIVLLGGMAYDTLEAAPKPLYYAVRVPIVGTALAFAFKFTGRHEIERQLEQAFTPDTAPVPYVQEYLSSMFKISQLKAAACDEITLNPALRSMCPQYGKIDVPVIILTGDQDKTVPPEKHSFPLHDAIPQSKLIVIHNAGHELQFTRSQDVVNAIDLAVQTSSNQMNPTASARTGN